MKGWHGRGRVIRHSGDDYAALLPAAIGQGISLYEVARQAKQELRLGLPLTGLMKSCQFTIILDHKRGHSGAGTSARAMTPADKDIRAPSRAAAASR
jgi:hypothetical protein